MRNGLHRPRIAPVLALALAVGASGCAAKVNQDVFDQEMAQIRSEMADVDGRVAANRADIASISQRLDILEAELETLRDEFDVAITRLESGIRFATPVHFDFDRSQIRPEDEPLLDRFADIVGSYYDGALITVEGFADPAGSAAYNQRLSEMRAQSVADYVETRGGIPSDALRAVGYGEDRQVSPGAQGPGSAGLVNRRVAFVIDYAPEPESSQLTASAGE